MTILLQGAGPQATTSTPADPIGDTLRADAVAYWKMDEASGTRVDATGHGNGLLDHNSTGSAAGVISNSAQFVAGNSNYLSHSSNSYLQMGDIDFSIALWIRLDSLDAILDRYAISKGLIGDEYSIRVANNLIVFTFIDGELSWKSATSPTPLSAGNWYFILAWHDVTTQIIHISVNGETPGGAFSVIAGAISTDDPFAAGAYSDESSFLDGRIDELGMWKRLLTQDERDYLYNSGAGRALFP